MEPKEFKSFFKTVTGNEGGKCRYPTRLDPYGCGCMHDCAVRPWPIRRRSPGPSPALLPALLYAWAA